MISVIFAMLVFIMILVIVSLVIIIVIKLKKGKNSVNQGNSFSVIERRSNNSDIDFNYKEFIKENKKHKKAVKSGDMLEEVYVAWLEEQKTKFEEN